MRKLAICFLLLASIYAYGQEQTYEPHELALPLRSQAYQALGKEDFAGAKPLLERWLEADPRDRWAWYHLARAYAVTGDKERALDAFERSVDAGLRDSEWPQRHTEFDSIRSAPRFEAALARIAKLLKAEVPEGYIRRFAPMRSLGSYVVMLPPDYETSGRDYPLCIILHGSGSTELNHGQMSDRWGRRAGIIYVAVRAPHPHIGVIESTGKPGFTAWPPDEIEDFDNSPLGFSVRVNYVEWTFDVVREVEQEFRTREGKVYAYGHSQGGQFATLSALFHPEKVASYLSFAGSASTKALFTEDRLGRMKQEGVLVWLMHGRQDPQVPIEASTTLAARLKDAGIPVTLHLVEGGHYSADNDKKLKIGQQWLSEVVIGEQ